MTCFKDLSTISNTTEKKTEELASVGRMIPVEEMVLPDKVTDLPVQGLKQFDGERTEAE